MYIILPIQYGLLLFKTITLLKHSLFPQIDSELWAFIL